MHLRWRNPCNWKLDLFRLSSLVLAFEWSSNRKLFVVLLGMTKSRCITVLDSFCENRTLFMNFGLYSIRDVYRLYSWKTGQDGRSEFLEMHLYSNTTFVCFCHFSDGTPILVLNPWCTFYKNDVPKLPLLLSQKASVAFPTFEQFCSVEFNID